MILVGKRVRIIEPGTGLKGRVVEVRGFKELAPGIMWPFFVDKGEEWPLNPEWLEPTDAPHTRPPAVVEAIGADPQKVARVNSEKNSQRLTQGSLL